MKLFNVYYVKRIKKKKTFNATHKYKKQRIPLRAVYTSVEYLNIFGRVWDDTTFYIVCRMWKKKLFYFRTHVQRYSRELYTNSPFVVICNLKLEGKFSRAEHRSTRRHISSEVRHYHMHGARLDCLGSCSNLSVTVNNYERRLLIHCRLLRKHLPCICLQAVRVWVKL